MEQNTTVTAATWARTICLLVALLNSLRTAFGNSFTKEAIEADELFARLRAENNARK